MCSWGCQGWSFIPPGLQRSYNGLLGCRIGEAANPGPHGLRGHATQPASTHITMCISNVGSLLNKADHVTSLGAQIVMLSETCATQASHILFSRRLCQSSFRAVWGAPVDVREECSSAYRGQNSGVACVASLPCRPFFGDVSGSAFTTGRIVPLVVRIGHIDVVRIIIYGIPSNRDPAMRRFLHRRFHLPQLQLCPVSLRGTLNCPIVPCFSIKDTLKHLNGVKRMVFHYLPRAMTCINDSVFKGNSDRT